MELHWKQLYAEAYSLRESLKFFGIPERENENRGDTQKALYEFIENVLDFDVHPIGKAKTNKPRAIIARFLCFSDREKVLRTGFKSMSMRGPGSGDTCHLTDFNETWPD